MAPKDGKHFDEDYLNKRKEMLQAFIDDVLEHPTLRVTQVFEDFLKIAGGDSFSQLMATYDNKLTMASVRVLEVLPNSKELQNDGLEKDDHQTNYKSRTFF